MIVGQTRQTNFLLQIFVLPIKPPSRNPSRPGKLDMQQIHEIAGSNGTIITAAIEGGFEALTDEFSEDVSFLICGNPCEHVLHDHD